MKLKRIVASALAIMTVATGAMGITASASSHSYSFSLSAGSVGYTSSYSTSGSSYGSVKPTSGVSSADFCTATFCNTSHSSVSSSAALQTINAKYHLDYTTSVSSACLKLTNTQSSKTVKGYYDPAGTI